jgi:hypothetical protein
VGPEGYEPSISSSSVFLALDAPDLMLITGAAILASKYVVIGVSHALRRMEERFPSSVTSGAKPRHGLQRLLRATGKLDLEDAVWKRVLYVTHYKRGLSYWLLALVAGISAIVYSYSIDFLSPRISELVVFTLLAVPSTIAVYAMKLPRGLASTRKEVGAIRRTATTVSLAVPLLAIPIVFRDPSLLGHAGVGNLTDQLFLGKFMGFVWLAIFPIAVALPLYSWVASAEFDDYAGFIRKARLLGI